MNNKPETILVAQHIDRVYKVDHETVWALKDVSVEIPSGEAVCIMGASGAGKSTLVHILGGLDQPSTGHVLFKGQDVYHLSGKKRTLLRARQMGYVFQAYHLLSELSVLENVLLPAMTRFDYVRSATHDRSHALELLEKVGLGQRSKHRPQELSGGEQQRVALARALMNGPELVLADEPTGNLDSKTGAQVLNYLFDLTIQRGHTLVMVTHNESIAAMCHRTIWLKDGGVL
ncbi:MAG: ATP-binding cassette domain-containing protein [Kiritimatiellae bacterium]|nr:ATP-binding cassette domain-containing protein [Kiritimatiellia bacterium]